MPSLNYQTVAATLKLMNPGMKRLQPYPFEKLAKLRAGVQPSDAYSPIKLSIGEPQEPAPEFILEAIRSHERLFGNYPATGGLPELRASIADWLIRRFSLEHADMSPDRNVVPVNGTREALFAFAQFQVDRNANAYVVMPNPFYQIYEGAAILAGAEPYYVNCLPENGFRPDWSAVPSDVWRKTTLLYVCSPGNPTGAALTQDDFANLIALSDEYGFVIASDECYSEIYTGEPPLGLLEACTQLGRGDYKNCLVFHSLSKRSNVPSMRSGFVAGDAGILSDFLRYRTYHGCAMPLPIQHASIAAWNDERHVEASRQRYAEKFRAVLPILQKAMNVAEPDASFYLWPETPGSDEAFCLKLYRDHNVHVLPGSYLSREVDGVIPGRNRIRISLVAPVEQCLEAAKRIAACAIEP